MKNNVKISCNPFTDSFGVAGEIVIKLHAPYSENNVTVQVNPNTVDYQEKPDENIRQLTVTKSTDETLTLQFDFKSNNSHAIELSGKKYDIKLMNIGKEKFPQADQEFFFFEFFVQEL